MSTDLTIIVDDTAFPFSYPSPAGSSTWRQIGSFGRYNTTSRYNVADQSDIVSFAFEGTSAAFIGSAPQQTFTVQIDSGASIVIVDPNPPTYKQWFTTPTLPDGRHTITISGDLYGAAIDYAVVKVGIHSSLTGQTVIVDDDSPLIQYSGTWSRNTSYLGDRLTGYPYRNGTSRSSNPGDGFAFRFSGTSIAVYGIFSFDITGLMTVDYSMNGTRYSTVHSSGQKVGAGESQNYLYFGVDSLPFGTHTLSVNITGVNNQAFTLDYITYKPTFDTLSSMPSLSSGVGTSSSTLLAPSASSTTSGSRKSKSIGLLGKLDFDVLVMMLVILLLLRRHSSLRM